MTDLPAANYFSDNDRTEGEVKQWGEDVRDVISELLGGSDEEPVTIDGGVVTPTKALVVIDTEAQTSADDLDRIDPANHPAGRLLVIRAADPGRVVTVKHLAGGTGQISTSTGTDMTLDSDRGVLLRRSGSQWTQVLGTAAQVDTQTSATDTASGLVAMAEFQRNLREIVTIPYDGTAPAGFTKNSAGEFVYDKSSRPWLKYMVGFLIGGGGGSAGQNNNDRTSPGGAGGGGSRKRIDYADLASSETLTIGAGGAQGGDADPVNDPGEDGGTTSFGAHFSATGGGGSPYGLSGGRDSADPGDGVGGDLNVSGGKGQPGGSNNIAGYTGAGGGSPFGAGYGGPPTLRGSNGQTGTGYGSGGGGGHRSTDTNRSGSAGQPGIAWFYFYG